MFALRRAAARSLQSQSFAIRQPTRSFTISTSRVPRTGSQVLTRWSQTRCYSIESENKSASPAEQEEGTVMEEPSIKEQKQEITEESVTNPDANSSSFTESAAQAAQAVMEQANSAAAKAAEVAKSVVGAGSSHDRPQRSERRDSRDTRDTREFRDSRDSRDSRGDSRGFRERNSDNRGGPKEPSKILYIGNLYFDLTAERLQHEFAPFGTIVNARIASDASGLSKGFGYVEFDSLDSAADAIRELDQQPLEGRNMTVQYHVRRGRTSTTAYATRNPPAKTLFIGNMSFQMSDKDLNELFADVKNVLDVRVAIDRRTGQPRGFAHADFIDTASAEKAMEYLQGKSVYGRELRVDFGLPSSPASSRRDE